MTEHFLGEIRLMSFAYPPVGWALCNGQIMPIQQNQALFALLGTAYGGNGQTTYGLPDLRGRVAVGQGPGYANGQRGGAATVTLGPAHLPRHTHDLLAEAAPGTSHAPAGRRPAATSNGWADGAPTTTLAPESLATVGGSQAHPNQQPYQVLSYCIALTGVFPSAS